MDFQNSFKTLLRLVSVSLRLNSNLPKIFQYSWDFCHIVYLKKVFEFYQENGRLFSTGYGWVAPYFPVPWYYMMDYKFIAQFLCIITRQEESHRFIAYVITLPIQGFLLTWCRCVGLEKFLPRFIFSSPWKRISQKGRLSAVDHYD